MTSLLRVALLVVTVKALPTPPRQLQDTPPPVKEPSSAVKQIGAATQAATGVKVSTGLPGITPLKKAATAAQTVVPPAAYTAFRSKLQDTICPTATGEDKESLECKSHAIRMELKQANMLDEAEKNVILQRRVQLFQTAGKKSSDDMFKEKVRSILFYKKAFGMYCASANLTTDKMCTNPLMLRTYGPAAKIPEAPKPKPPTAKPNPPTPTGAPAGL